MGNLMYLMEEFMYMALMISTMVMFSAWEIMYAGQPLLRIFLIGDTKALFTPETKIR